MQAHKKFLIFDSIMSYEYQICYSGNVKCM